MCQSRINTAIDKYRRYNSCKFESYMKDDPVISEEIVLNGMMVDDLMAIVQKLPDTYRLVFNLHEIEGYSHEEISKKLSVTASTVRANLCRAKNKLKELILKYEAA